MTSILFTGVESRGEKPLGFGDFAYYMLACNCRAKELGFDKIYAVFPKLEGPFVDIKNRELQTFKMIPIEFINKESIDNIQVDKREVIYETDISSIYNYLNYYFIKYNRVERFKKERDILSKKYIIMQYRKINGKGEDRNSSMDFLFTFNNIKSLLEDKYKYIKCGEYCKYDNMFDEVLPLMYDNVDKFIYIIRNSSLIISSHSGVYAYALLFEDIPYFCIDVVFKEDKEENPYLNRWKFDGSKYKDTYYTRGNPPSKEVLSNYFKKVGLI